MTTGLPPRRQPRRLACFGADSVRDDRHRAVIVAVVTMHVMKSPVHQVVDVIAVRNRHAVGGPAVHRLAIGGIGGAHVQAMLVDVALMGMVKVAVMEVIDMVLMPNADMPAVAAMHMGMLIMGLAIHGVAPFRVRSIQRSSLG